MIRSVERWCRLPPPRRRLFVTALWRLMLVAVSLRVRGFGRTRWWLENRKFSGRRLIARDRERGLDLGTIVWAVAAGAKYSPLGSTCLARSLVLCSLLRDAAVDAQLRFGVRLTGGGWEAHAWVEVGGEVIGDPAEVPRVFKRLEPFGSFGDGVSRH